MKYWVQILLSAYCSQTPSVYFWMYSLHTLHKLY